MRSVVVFSPNWLGDAVMALPALDDIRCHDRSARLTVATREKLAGFFERVPGVDRVLPLAGGGGLRAVRAWTADARRLAEARFDTAILLTNSFHTAWIARRANVAERWGYRRDGRGFLLTRAVPPPRGRHLHQAEYYQGLTAALGMANGPLAAAVEPGDRARSSAFELLRARGVEDTTTLVGMAPGAAYGHAKQWPPERYAAVVAALTSGGITSVLVGSPGDRAAGIEIERHLARLDGTEPRAARPGPVNLIGKTDLGTLMGVMARCRAFVSNDSGAMHLAAAVGVPIVAVFGSSDERSTAPLPHRVEVPLPGTQGFSPVCAPRPPVIITHPVWCRPCMLRECPIDHRCMRRIDPSQVVEAVRRQGDL
jgi:heptosyltransferase-2